MTRFWDGRTDRRTESDCTPRPAFAFGDAGKNPPKLLTAQYISQYHFYAL